jgi:glycosyltransferase involved in cell wall biosynthesis
MKILFIAPRFHTNMHAYVKGLKEMGHEVFFLAMYKSNSEDYKDLEPIIIKANPLNYLFAIFDRKYKKPMHQWPCLPVLWQELSRLKPDVLLVKNLQGGLSFFSLLFGRFHAKKTFALVQTDRHAISSVPKKAVAWGFKSLLRVDGIVSPLKNVLPVSDPWFRYLPFVIDVKDFSKSYFKDGMINILEVGKFQARKEHLLMLEAFKRLKSRYQVRLTIVGERYDQKVLGDVHSYIRDNDLEGDVTVLENLPYGQILAMYKDFDLFVLPSKNEPAAYSPVEAFAHKLPVIVSDSCGTSCYIEEGVNGHIFRSGDANDLAAKIEAVISDRETLLKMSEKAFTIARDNHSLGYFKGKIGEIIDLKNG